MPKEKIYKWIEVWDNREYEKMAKPGLAGDPDEHKKRKHSENRHDKMFKEILFLEQHFYGDYELNEYKTFIEIFLKWLDQFKGHIDFIDDDILNSERRYAFILARNIIFINRRQILSLLNEIWENIKRELLKLASKERSISLIEIMYSEDIINEQLNASVFVPLSDSSHFMEFRHRCLPSGKASDLVIPCIDRLFIPIEYSVKELLKKQKDKFRSKKNLFVIEDFSGSGTNAKKMKQIIEYYDFKNIYFCPCIITNISKNALTILYDIASKKNKNFKVISGMTIGDEHSISDDKSSDIWSEEEKRALRYISEKYFALHFKENRYLYLDFKKNNPQKPAPLGFKNCGLALTLYTNCPNNSLPIIWADNNNWNPLFIRKERYANRLTND